MKIRGFLALLMLTMVVVYFIFFAKVGGGKGGLQTEVDQYLRVKVKLTMVNFETLARAVQSYAAGAEGLPEDLKQIQRFGPLGSGVLDAWGNVIHYEKLTDTTFRLRSAGPDGAYETADDVVKDY
jgi:hypothetical protein